jgi:probable rRNA maturation factor
MNRITVTALEKRFSRKTERISVLVRKVFLLLGKDGLGIEIYLISNVVMRKINKTYRGKDKVTNVLSFREPQKFMNAPSRLKYLGEIYIGLDFIEKHGQNTSLMIVHGMLHLLGYDHKTIKERISMEKKEGWLMGKI